MPHLNGFWFTLANLKKATLSLQYYLSKERMTFWHRHGPLPPSTDGIKLVP